MTFTLPTSGKCVGKHVKENVERNFINFFNAENSIFKKYLNGETLEGRYVYVEKFQGDL